MSRQYTPDEIRQIGSQACPAIAASYELLGPSAKSLSTFKDDLFGTHPNTATWAELFDLFKTAVDETPVSVGAMGQALVAVADGYDADEQDIVVDLGTSLADLEADFEANREAIAGQRAQEEAQLLEQARESAANASGAEAV
jgi:hypothetical protein